MLPAPYAIKATGKRQTSSHRIMLGDCPRAHRRDAHQVLPNRFPKTIGTITVGLLPETNHMENPKQAIVWTVLPNGVTEDRLRLSVFIAPQLKNPQSVDVLPLN